MIEKNYMEVMNVIAQDQWLLHNRSVASSQILL